VLGISKNRADQPSDDFNCVIGYDEMRKRKVERKSEVKRWVTE